MADIYRVICAHLAEPHEHVTGLKVKRWKSKEAGFADPEELTRDEAAALILGGDTFQVASRDGKTTVQVVNDYCDRDKCSTLTLRTVADDTKTDNLDYLGCD